MLIDKTTLKVTDASLNLATVKYLGDYPKMYASVQSQLKFPKQFIFLFDVQVCKI